VPDVDRPVVDRMLADRSVPARWVCWDDPSVDWSSFTGAWIRSPWDYTTRHRQFLAWVERAGSATRVWNPPDVVAWNSHKSYLCDLAGRGVPVVPTVVVAGGQALDLGALATAQGWGEVVVKPAVSVGAIGAHRVARGGMGAWTARHATEAPPGGDRLVQPLMAEVADGETSMIAVEGRITHAVRKVPAPGDFRVHVEYGGQESPHRPSDAEYALAEQALAAVGADLLYARVDCVTTSDGPLLMELELIEPSLFLPLAPPAAVAALADSVVARL
jgi:glutathione synthase/RimK-type ligase-like ATP-grasp enzyme